MTEWYKEWFNLDYLHLYPHRSWKEAVQCARLVMQVLDLKGDERVLDLGCGAGRHALEFQNLGFSVTGVDYSADLVEVAKSEAKRKGLDVDFCIGDMRDLNAFPSNFHLVLSLFTSFGYFDSDEENQGVLGQIYQRLLPEGHLVLDYLNPSYVEKCLVDHEEKQVLGEKVILERRIEGGYVFKDIIFPNRQYQERVRLFSHEEIGAMLDVNAFSLVGVFGDYEGAPWSSESDRQIFFAKRDS